MRMSVETRRVLADEIGVFVAVSVEYMGAFTAFYDQRERVEMERGPRVATRQRPHGPLVNVTASRVGRRESFA